MPPARSWSQSLQWVRDTSALASEPRQRRRRPEIKCDPRLADVAQPQLRILGQTPPQRANEVWRRARGQRSQSGSPAMTAFSASVTVVPVNGGCRAHILNSTQPNAQMSVRLSTASPARLLRAHVTRGSDDGTNLRRMAASRSASSASRHRFASHRFSRARSRGS